jgi:DNA-binding HxlR family transcriptional regulator
MKSYRQFCAVSRALDVLGDRWALLVIRELLLGTRRYTDLSTALPGIPSSVLTIRLRDLELANVVRRKTLPPPAAAVVYELTPDGQALRPIVDELARWGLRLMDHPEDGDSVRAGWLTYSLSVSLPPAVLPAGAALELRLDGEVNTVFERAERLEARWGAATNPLAIIESSIRNLYLIATGNSDQRELQRQQGLTIIGDVSTGERFLDAAYGVWRSDPQLSDR